MKKKIYIYYITLYYIILYIILYILLYFIYYIIYIILYYRVDLLTKESQPDCIHVDHNRIDDPLPFKII